MRDISVYVHVPFCVSKCLYCDFYSVVSGDFETYFSYLERELELYHDVLADSKVVTLYFGGGTPSLVPTLFLEKVVRKLQTLAVGFDPIEITIELNPETVTREKLREYKLLGVNRVSLGVQAVDDEVLKGVGRIYDRRTLEKSAACALELFENVNFDFILGLPNETDETVEKDTLFLDRYPPKHVSLYLLEVDEKAPLFKRLESGNLSLPSAEEVEERHSRFVIFLREKGYVRYEISNFAVEGWESLHNLRYWRNEDYLGFGPSAGGHVGRVRYVNVSDLKTYYALLDAGRKPYEHFHENAEREEELETVFMGLRTKEGVPLEKLKSIGGIVEKILQEFQCCLKVKNGKIFLNERGMDLSRFIFERLVELLEEDER